MARANLTLLPFLRSLRRGRFLVIISGRLAQRGQYFMWPGDTPRALCMGRRFLWPGASP
jgi:hypothetical protein